MPRSRTKLATALFLTSISLGAFALALITIVLVSAIKNGFGAFQNAAISPALALLGSCLATLASAYVVNLQKQVSEDLAAFTVQSNQQLEKLKVELGSKQIAYRELLAAASVYYYTLRSSARNRWDASAIQEAEGGMIKASHHLIYVEDDLASGWQIFWQQAQYIFREVRDDESDRLKEQLLKDKIVQEFGASDRANLRDLHAQLEKAAKSVLRPQQ